MSRRASPESLWIARRMGLAGRLTSSGMLVDVAEGYILAWETEARARGLDARTPAFWDGAAAWIEGQRRGES